jgi:hypothetical protein
MEVWGEPLNCLKGDCQWWTYTIEIAATKNIDDSSTDPSCNPPGGPSYMLTALQTYDNIRFHLLRANNLVNASNYHDPFTAVLEEAGNVVDYRIIYDENDLASENVLSNWST